MTPLFLYFTSLTCIPCSIHCMLEENELAVFLTPYVTESSASAQVPYQILETEFRVKKKISLLLHQAKGDTPGFCLEKLCPKPRRLDDGVYNSGLKMGSLTRLGCEQKKLRVEPTRLLCPWGLSSKNTR